MAKKDFYATLGVNKSVSVDGIKSAYRKLARKHHPDIDKSLGAEAKFKEISEAYQVLSDPGKRQTYDQFGSAAFEPGAGMGGGNPFAGGNPFGQGFSYSWSSGGGQPFGNAQGGSGFSDPFDLFEQIFGGGFAEQFSQGFRRRQSFQMELSFEEAVHGVTKEVEIERVEGNNNRRVRDRMSIKVPAGVDNGTRMRFGDVDIIFRVRRSSEFVRDGSDIFTEASLSIPQVVLGDVIDVKTIDGLVKLKVPAGAEPGSLIRVKGKGVPTLRGGRGDHYVRVKLSVPKHLTNQEKQLYQQLADVSQKKKGWF